MRLVLARDTRGPGPPARSVYLVGIVRFEGGVEALLGIGCWRVRAHRLGVSLGDSLWDGAFGLGEFAFKGFLGLGVLFWEMKYNHWRIVECRVVM